MKERIQAMRPEERLARLAQYSPCVFTVYQVMLGRLCAVLAARILHLEDIHNAMITTLNMRC